MPQLIWKLLQGGPAAELEAVSARMTPGTSVAIERPLGIGWLDMYTHMDMCVAIEDVLGAERHREIWRSIIKEFGGSRLLRGFFKIADRSGTAGVMRRVDVAYAAQTRGLGATRCLDANDEHAMIELRGFPAQEFSFANYVNGLQGTLMAAIEVSGGSRPSVDAEHIEGATGLCRYRLSWAAPD